MRPYDFGQQLYDYYEYVDRLYHIEFTGIMEYLELVFRDDITRQKYADSNPIRRGSLRHAKIRIFNNEMEEEMRLQNLPKYFNLIKDKS